MYDIQLTRHFMLSEFTKSETATKYGIDNTPGSTGSPTAIEVISNLQYLCREILEPLREWMNEPITISSGYRCPQLNSHPSIKGAKNSQHLTGEAADIRIPMIKAPNPSTGSGQVLIQDMATARKWIEWILDNRFDQLILEHDKNGHYWIHVSITRTNNRQTYIPNLLKNL